MAVYAADFLFLGFSKGILYKVSVGHFTISNPLFKIKKYVFNKSAK